MKTLRFGKPQSPAELEKALGLQKGQILEKRTSGDGAEVEIDFADSVNLPDAALEVKLEKVLGLLKKA